MKQIFVNLLIKCTSLLHCIIVKRQRVWLEYNQTRTELLPVQKSKTKQYESNKAKSTILFVKFLLATLSCFKDALGIPGRSFLLQPQSSQYQYDSENTGDQNLKLATCKPTNTVALWVRMNWNEEAHPRILTQTEKENCDPQRFDGGKSRFRINRGKM